MAHIARLSESVRGAVAGELIQEGRLVRLTVSGVRNDLPVAMLAASGTTRNVYIAMVPPDDFARPTPATMYSAGFSTTLRESGSWGDFVETNTFYRVGLSTLENPFMPSGYLLQAHRETVVTVPSGCVVANASLKTVGSLAKVSDDGTGRFEYTTSDSVAVARVVDWEPSLDQYTFEFGL